jgi:hypothetical protein
MIPAPRVADITYRVLRYRPMAGSVRKFTSSMAEG